MELPGPSGWERGLSLRVGRQWELGCGVEVSAYPGGRGFYIQDTKVGILFDCGERDVPISASAASFFFEKPFVRAWCGWDVTGCFVGRPK